MGDEEARRCPAEDGPRSRSRRYAAGILVVILGTIEVLAYLGYQGVGEFNYGFDFQSMPQIDAFTGSRNHYPLGPV